MTKCTAAANGIKVHGVVIKDQRSPKSEVIFFHLDSAIAESEVWSQRLLSVSLRPNFGLSDF